MEPDPHWRGGAAVIKLLDNVIQWELRRAKKRDGEDHEEAEEELTQPNKQAEVVT